VRLEGKKVAVLLAEGFEDLEYWVTVMRLQEEGAEVVSVGPDTEPVSGKNALFAQADTTAVGVEASELDGVVVPGGWAPDKLRRYPEITDLVRSMHDRNKTVGIICHGGLVAISAGIVGGARATGSLGIKDDLENAGATWVDKGTH
jgi:protease I